MSTYIEISDLTVSFRTYNDHIPTLKQTIIQTLKRKSPGPESHIVLDKLSIRFSDGDKVGILGRNGTGKSTLLKSIVGIYPPHEGKVIVNGFAAALLELGAGFDMTRTAKENIYINGAILGRSKSEMDLMVDDILEFAELQEFPDMPASHLSSGMRSRLSFSIATAIQPEILILDEVFAAGDAAFINKARKRMGELIDACHILLFVSHSAELVTEFCNQAIVLDSGKIVFRGDPQDAVDYYNKEIVKL